MALVQETFEGGSDGVTVALSNTNFYAITPNIVFDNAEKAHGSLSALFDPTTGTGRYCRYNLPAGTTSVAASCYVRLGSLSAADERLMLLTDASGTTIAYIVANPAGKLRFGNTGSSATWTATNTYPINTWLRLEFYIVCGSTTSNGTAKVGIYLGDSTSPIETVFLATNLNIGGGGATIGQIRFGKTSGTLTTNAWFDDCRYDTAATDLLGPVANIPPTVSLTGNQDVSASAAVTIAVSATDPDGTIATYAATVDTANSTNTPTLTGASTASVSFTAPAAPNLITISETVTDSGGATATATTEVRVPVTGGTATKPMNVTPITSGSWTIVGGAANHAAAVGDASDATYLESGAVSATIQTYRQRLEPSAARATCSLTSRLSSDTGTVNWTIKLYEGATLRQTWTQSTGSTPTDYVFAFSAPTIAAISDWGNLWAEHGVTT
jgi:hypothetical protein